MRNSFLPNAFLFLCRGTSAVSQQGKKKRKRQRIFFMRERNRRLTEADAPIARKFGDVPPKLARNLLANMANPPSRLHTLATEHRRVFKVGLCCVFGRDDSLNNCPTLDSIVPHDKSLFRQRTEDNAEVGVPTCDLRADGPAAFRNVQFQCSVFPAQKHSPGKVLLSEERKMSQLNNTTG